MTTDQSSIERRAHPLRRGVDGAAVLRFYDRGAVCITGRWLTVGDCRYRIEQLSTLRKARGPADRIAQLATCTVALALPVLVAIGSYLPPRAVLVMVVVFVAVPLVLAMLRFWLRPAAHLLWADYRGYPVQLYQSRDATEFGKISRALVRASAHARRG